MNVREWALPVYTILMQLAVGALLGLWLIRVAALRRYPQEVAERMVRIPLLAIFLTLIGAVIGSHFHLSRPYLSLLAILNLRSSWLSREILFTVLCFFALTSLVYLAWSSDGRSRAKGVLGWVAILAGFSSIYCMSQIYRLPTHTSWNTQLTLLGFLLTAVILGATSLAVLLMMELRLATMNAAADAAVHSQIFQHVFGWLAAVTGLAALMIAGVNLRLVATLQAGDASAQSSYLLLSGLYHPLVIMRYGSLAAGVIGFGLSVYLLYRRRKPQLEMTVPIYAICLLVLISEITGRFLFYATHVRLGL